ncbi:hypothetical protein [Pararhizobium sp. A13]|uniref:hypothetical protein n=1 Tax=Pararhizobium sp. A13 TaxID=3133975 RepID=UPI00324A668D
MNLTKRDFTKGLVLAAGFAGFGLATVQAVDVIEAEARATAKEAYIYGFPMVEYA